VDRRTFLGSVPLLAGAGAVAVRAARAEVLPAGSVMTVRGPVPAAELGKTLAHEHVLVDFIGADRVSRDRYDAEEVFRTVLPHLRAVKEAGAESLLECTPAWLGRDPLLLRRLSEASGLHIVTNTGYYGAAKDKHLPAHTWTETADQLAARWTREFEQGIEATGIRPGFLKTGVDAGPLSEVDRKLITAAARCHLRTGLAIGVHTGDGAAAEDILAVLRVEGTAPSAYVWIHAQNERNLDRLASAAEAGAWVELDGISPESLRHHADAVASLIARGHLRRLLVSQDAGWYHVGEKGGGAFRGYTLLFEAFLPELRRRGITEDQVHTLVTLNPAAAFTVAPRPRVP
jgi:predicted metal-dependent phosphotriesterase family hydrolase